MFICLPIIAFILLFLIIGFNNEWRSSILASAIVWGIIITVSTEILSIFRLLNFGEVLEVWLLVNIILIIIYYKLSKSNKSGKNSLINKFPTSLKFLLFGVGFVVAAIGLIAVISPTNNWDSMDYHMSRIAYWIQNQSVAHYPTSYTPQLYQNPWSEFAIMHFQILSGGDYFANLVQWLSMLGCVLGTSLITKQLGADLQGQVFAAVVNVTIPMGILQASTTQNDYVIAFWLVCLVHYVIIIIQSGKNTSQNNYFLLGSSLGLTILTKGTAYFYVFPFLVWLSLLQIRRLRWQVIKPAIVVSLIALSINISHYLRNYNLFASPLGEPSNYKNELLGINIMFSNILRNLALHIGTPIGFFNGKANKIIQIIHQIIGVDINDPRITFSKEFFVPGGWSTIGFSGNENNAGNLLHLLLILSCIAIFLLKPNLRKQKYVTSYLVSIIAIFCLFCYFLKWQGWNSRLHLPLFVILSPFVGLVLSKISYKKAVNYLAILLIISALPWVFFNRYKPLIDSNNIFQVSRIEQYFSNRPKLKEPYLEAANFLNSKDCSAIGLAMGNDPWEYPLWVILQQNKEKKFQLQHVNVKNISGVKEKEYPYKSFEPCGLIYMETKKSKQKKLQEINFKNQTFVRALNLKELAIFLKK